MTDRQTEHIYEKKEYVLAQRQELDTLQEKEKSVTNEFEIHSTNRGIFHQVLITGAVLLLAAACGMPIGYSAVLLPQLYNSSEPLSMDINLGSWFASIHSLATPFGSFASGPIADRFGRRPALLLSIFPLILGWSLLALAQSHVWLIIGRIIAGVAVGLVGAPAQIFIGEIAQPRLRGLLIGVPFTAYSMGILLVYALGSELHWREVAWCGTLLPLLSAVSIFMLPESPAWLVRNGELTKASRALSWIRGDSVSAKRELNMLVTRFEQENSSKRANDNFLQSCAELSALKPLVIINIFNLLQILSGTYIVVFYAVDLISEYGGHVNAMTAAVMTAVVRLAFTMVFCFLLLIMRRRSLIMCCGLGSAISATIFGIYSGFRFGHPKSTTDIYLAGFCLLFYIASNTGFLVLPGIMTGELLPAKIRGRVAGYVFALFNILLFAATKLFPFAQQTFKTFGLFLIFGAASLGASIFMYLFLPETKGKTLQEIEDYFENNSWVWLRRKRITKHVDQVDNA